MHSIFQMIECPTLAFLQNKSLTDITGDALFVSDTARNLKLKFRSIHDRNRAHYAILDQANKFVNPAVAPAQMLPTTVTKTERPCMSRKPRVFERRLACLTAANRLRKSDNLKADAIGICEHKLIPAIVSEPVPFSRDMVKTPRAKPVAGGIAARQRG